ncbi:ribosomal protein S21 [Cryptococcus amylolentus CBS 6039]|uniref:Ribosomal protein S21 n=2 Tax=Cryptococcus amylolentus TaxID=104669 RepID=A0A1E3HPW7_9TREE|nr:ribosomal protein S21 [Cryptococcus amylolentus CBS 6039]ODN77756.1 ribosomal protein S21 [Cryptococcus amylolentus CBS 6039]ODO05756.1 ribosomal protein S21 [Cryptococcus amylolentus CBS 6273]
MSLLFRSAVRASSSRLPMASIAPALPRRRLPLPAQNITVPLLSRFNSSLPKATVTTLEPQSQVQSQLEESQRDSTRGAGFDIKDVRIPESSSKSSLQSPNSPSGLSDPTSEDWWMHFSSKPSDASLHRSSSGLPSKYFSGRSIALTRGGDFMQGYRRLQSVVRSGNMKKEARLNEFYEKPSLRRRRLRSERHRRRFKEMVRTKVQQALAMRSKA